jgi:hypothetical protein
VGIAHDETRRLYIHRSAMPTLSNLEVALPDSVGKIARRNV